MSGVTDADREKATGVVEQIAGVPWDVFSDTEFGWVEHVAAALAEEREKALDEAWLRIHVQRFAADQGTFSGPDNFYAGGVTPPIAVAMGDQLHAEITERAMLAVAEMTRAEGVSPTENEQVYIEIGIQAGLNATMRGLAERGWIRVGVAE